MSSFIKTYTTSLLLFYQNHIFLLLHQNFNHSYFRSFIKPLTITNSIFQMRKMRKVPYPHQQLREWQRNLKWNFLVPHQAFPTPTPLIAHRDLCKGNLKCQTVQTVVTQWGQEKDCASGGKRKIVPVKIVTVRTTLFQQLPFSDGKGRNNLDSTLYNDKTNWGLLFTIDSHPFKTKFETRTSIYSESGSWEQKINIVLWV